jgi:hypothetical protein
MIITRPCRRMTRHFSQILLTEGWTFMFSLPSLDPRGRAAVGGARGGHPRRVPGDGVLLVIRELR